MLVNSEHKQKFKVTIIVQTVKLGDIIWCDFEAKGDFPDKVASKVCKDWRGWGWQRST